MAGILWKILCKFFEHFSSSLKLNVHFRKNGNVHRLIRRSMCLAFDTQLISFNDRMNCLTVYFIKNNIYSAINTISMLCNNQIRRR